MEAIASAENARLNAHKYYDYCQDVGHNIDGSS